MDPDIETMVVSTREGHQIYLAGHDLILHPSVLILPTEHSMTIEVYYRSMRALSRQVDNPNGCMLYSKQPWDEGIHLGMEPIHLPDITDIADPQTHNATQTISLTNDVLNCFAKGYVW